MPLLPVPPWGSPDQLCCCPPPALQQTLLISLCFPWLTYYFPRHFSVQCDYTEDTGKDPSSAILALWLQNQQIIRSLLFHKHKCHGSYSAALLNSALLWNQWELCAQSSSRIITGCQLYNVTKYSMCANIWIIIYWVSTKCKYQPAPEMRYNFPGWEDGGRALHDRKIATCLIPELNASDNTRSFSSSFHQRI